MNFLTFWEGGTNDETTMRVLSQFFQVYIFRFMVWVIFFLFDLISKGHFFLIWPYICSYSTRYIRAYNFLCTRNKMLLYFSIFYPDHGIYKKLTRFYHILDSLIWLIRQSCVHLKYRKSTSSCEIHATQNNKKINLHIYNFILLQFIQESKIPNIHVFSLPL